MKHTKQHVLKRNTNDEDKIEKILFDETIDKVVEKLSDKLSHNLDTLVNAAARSFINTSSFDISSTPLTARFNENQQWRFFEAIPINERYSKGKSTTFTISKKTIQKENEDDASVSSEESTADESVYGKYIGKYKGKKVYQGPRSGLYYFCPSFTKVYLNGPQKEMVIPKDK